MNARKFEDYFGNIDFLFQKETGCNISSSCDCEEEPLSIEDLRKKSINIKREINKNAHYLDIVGKEKLIVTHNKNADKMAKELAKDWAMHRCSKCGQYSFTEECGNAGCGK